MNEPMTVAEHRAAEAAFGRQLVEEGKLLDAEKALTIKGVSLLPCPFCGAKAHIEAWHGGGSAKRMISCDNPACHVKPQVTGPTQKSAFERWNARP